MKALTDIFEVVKPFVEIRLRYLTVSAACSGTMPSGLSNGLPESESLVGAHAVARLIVNGANEPDRVVVQCHGTRSTTRPIHLDVNAGREISLVLGLSILSVVGTVLEESIDSIASCRSDTAACCPQAANFGLREIQMSRMLRS